MQGVNADFPDQNSVPKKALYVNKAVKNTLYLHKEPFLVRGGENQIDLSPRSHTGFVVAPAPPKPRQ